MKILKKQKIFIAILIVVLLLSFFIFYNRPIKKAERFINKYSVTLEEKINADQPIPNEMLGKLYNEWPGEHPMYEFILTTWGNSYFGCYYSPDDVPLPFQNSGMYMTEHENSWEWKESKGDNQGKTVKIRENWYYFEASF